MAYALITGASKGIGKAMAEQLAARGFNLLLVARSENLLIKLSQQLKNKYKIDVQYFEVDLSENYAANRVNMWCIQHKFPVSILINNAGYAVWGMFDKLTLPEQQNMLQLNINSMVELTYYLIPILKKQPKSFILNVSSTTAYQAVPCISLYAASKAFVLSFTRGLRYELRSSTISVSCLSPGSTSTSFMERANMQPLEKVAEKFSMSPEVVAKIGLNGMFQKKSEIIPGFVNKITASVTSILPKSLLEKIAAGIYEKNLPN